MKIRILNDECQEGMCKVVIINDDGKTIGVPLHGVSRAMAEKMVWPLAWACQYGMGEAHTRHNALSSAWCRVEYTTEPEE